MLSLFGIEHYLFGLNGSYKLPYIVSDNIVKQSHYTNEYFNNLSNDIFEEWCQQQDVHDLPFIHPNLIHYLIDDNTTLFIKKNKTLMAYQFIRALDDIDIMSKFFDDDGYTTIPFIVENNSPLEIYKTDRISCKIPILESSYHGIEFLDTEKDYHRAIVQPKLSNMNNDYIYNWYIYKDNWFNELYRKNYIYELIYKMKYYHYIENNEELKIEYISKLVNITPELSKILLESHENKDEYTVSINKLMNVFHIHNRKSLCHRFMKSSNTLYKLKVEYKSKEFNNNDLIIELDESDLDDYTKQKQVNNFIFKDCDVFLNYNGIYILTKLITENNFKKLDKINYLNVFELYDKIGKAAVNSTNLLFILYKKSMIPGYNVDNYINYGLNVDKSVEYHNKSIDDIDIVGDLISSIEIIEDKKQTITKKLVREKTNKLHELNGYYGNPNKFDLVDDSDQFNIFAANNKKFTVSTQILTPNLINYFINKKYAKFEVKRNKNFLVSTDDLDNKIDISKQIKFIYELVEVIKQIKNKNKKSPFNDWFRDNETIEIIYENLIKNIYSKHISSRIDFTFVVENIIPNKDYYFGVEFLEMATHKSQENNMDYSELARHHKINLNNELHYGNMFYIWEDNWKDNNYRIKFVKHIESVLAKLKSVNLSSQKRFAVEYFNEYLQNEETSKMIIEAYLDEYNYILKYNKIIKQFLIKNNLDEFKELFIDLCDKVTELKKCENYYKYVDDILWINSHGLYVMVLIIERHYFERNKDYIKIYDIYGHISQANVDAINKVHGLMKEILTDKNNKKYGLDHLSNKNYFK